MTHLMEHKKAVSRLAVVGSGVCVVSGSVDETVKVWDLRRMERDVAFRSRLTYSMQAGPITCVAAVEDDSSVASGSASGSLHVWRIETLGRGGQGSAGSYSGILAKRQLRPGQGAVLEVQAWGPHALVYLTQYGGVHAWDLRVKQDVWRLACPPSQGLVQHLVLEPLPCGPHSHPQAHCPSHPQPHPYASLNGPPSWGGTGNWLLTGSSRGVCSLWDVRFQLRANAWQHPMRCPIDAMALAAAPPPALGVLPSFPHSAPLPPPPGGPPALPFFTSTSSGSEAGLNSPMHSSSMGGRGGAGAPLAWPAAPLVYMAAGCHEVGLWDLSTGQCLQVVQSSGGEGGGEASFMDTSAGGRGEQGAAVLGGGAASIPSELGASHSGQQQQQQHNSGRAGVGQAWSSGNVPGALQPSVQLQGGAGGLGGRWQQDGGGGGWLGGEDWRSGAVRDIREAVAAPSPRVQGVRCLLPLPSGLLLTGSSDRCIRCWDGVKPESSYLVAGPLWPSDNLVDRGAVKGLAVPQYRYTYTRSLVTPAYGGAPVPVLQERCKLEGVSKLLESSQELRQKMRVHDQCHADALTHMVIADSQAPGSTGHLLITAARDGSVKAWK